MAGSKSDYLENAFLDHLYGGTTLTPPATIYIALFTVAPTDSGGGTEVFGGSYVRKAVTNNTTNFPNAVSGSKSLHIAQTFVTATGSWGTVVAFAYFDASTAGNMLHYGDLTASKTIGSGDSATFAADAIVVTEA